jgi:diaminopimelate decarboxylase
MQVEEDDVFALLNAGAYSSSMASNHCLRGDFKEFLLL